MTRAMKDSGIQWIGQIPEDWSTQRIKYCSSLKTGNSIKDEEKKKYEDRENARPYIATKDIDVINKKANYNNGMFIKFDDKTFNVAPKGSTLMCIEGGSAGKKKTFLTRDVCYVNKLCCFIPTGINDKYLFFCLGSPHFETEFESKISGLIGGVSVSELGNIFVTLPNNTEQNRIANFLDQKCSAIDSVLEKTRASIEEYKKLKQSVITQAVTKGIRPNRQMKDSGIEWIGQIPEDWKIVPLKYLCNMQAGKTLSSEQISPVGDYPVYGGNGLRGFYKDYNTEGSYLLVGRQGALCGNVHKADGKFWATEHAVVTSIYENNNLKFMYYLLIGMNLNQYISSVAAQPGLSVNTILNVRTCKVSLAEQQTIADYLDTKCTEIDNLIAKKEQFLKEIETYKKSLIYEYVTGKKEVL